MVLGEAYLLCDILAALEVVIAIWENLRLNNGHQAILLKKKNKRLAYSDLIDLYTITNASLCTGGGGVYLLTDAGVSG